MKLSFRGTTINLVTFFIANTFEILRIKTVLCVQSRYQWFEEEVEILRRLIVQSLMQRKLRPLLLTLDKNNGDKSLLPIAKEIHLNDAFEILKDELLHQNALEPSGEFPPK